MLSMGSWNKTCGISNLHIYAGTPVYVFVLEKLEDYDPCYSTGLFKPLLLPFESTYNDYGGGCDDHGVALDIIMASIKDLLVEMEVGENEYHDIAVKKEGFNAEKFFEAVNEDRLMIKQFSTKSPTNIYFTMFRKDIVDDLIENRVIVEYVGSNKGTFCPWGSRSNNYIQYKFADIVADVPDMVNAIVEECKGNSLYDLRYMMDVSELENKAIKWITRYDSYNYSRLVDMDEVIFNCVNVADESSINFLGKVLIEHIRAIYIDSFITSARKLWIPGGHEGSQSESGDSLRMLGNAINKVLEKEQAEFDES
jgi:hypothetical protein